MVNEAMLCRRPCLISTNVAAAGGLVENEVNGYVVDSLDVWGFVNVIEKYFALSADDKLQMADAAYARAMQFAYEPNMPNVLASVNYALSNARRR